MTNEQLIALARKHARGHSFYSDNAIVMSPAALRSLLQAVADAAREQDAKACLIFQNEWYELADIDAGEINFAGRCEDAIRNLKGTLPEMEG